MATFHAPLRGNKLNSAYCRRLTSRAQLHLQRTLCWKQSSSPYEVAVIEADSRGARLVLPFQAKVGETINVSFSDELGLHQTRRARIAWVYQLETAHRTLAGLAFERPLSA